MVESSRGFDCARLNPRSVEMVVRTWIVLIASSIGYGLLITFGALIVSMGAALHRCEVDWYEAVFRGDWDIVH